MTLPDSDIHRFFAHYGLYQFGSNLAGVFFIAFMLHQGVSPALVFAAIATMFLLRFSLRPLVVVVAKIIGLRNALVLGTCLSGFQYVALAHVAGLDVWLLAWAFSAALSDVFYWTLFHVVFTAIGAPARLGRQVSLRQIIAAAASVVGPPVGGFLLTFFPPILAFTLAAGLCVVSAIPLLGVTEPPFEREPPGQSFMLSFGARVFLTDGWVNCSAGTAWAIISFLGLGGRFDQFGFALAVAGLAGSAGGFLLGRAIDFGRGRQAVLVNLVAAVTLCLAEAAAGPDLVRIVVVMIAGVVVGGLAMPAMMAAFYSEGKAAACSLRFQFAAEGAWDVGAVAASLTCAVIAATGAPLQVAILLAIPVLFIQGHLLAGNYKARDPTLARNQGSLP